MSFKIFNIHTMNIIIGIVLSLVLEGVAIIGGLPVLHYPFFVQVHATKKVCGGTLIASDAVLTAAHCLRSLGINAWVFPAEIRVLKSRERTWQRSPTRHSCERYIYHELYDPNYNKGLGPYDIAVIKLAESIDLSQRQNGLLKPCSHSVEYNQGRAIGFGLTKTNPDVPAKVLMETSLTLYSSCGVYFEKHGVKIDEAKQVCYGSLSKIKPAGTCYGDYGGPLVHQREFDEKTICLMGIASFSSRSCSDPSIPSVFTRAGYFAEWIECSLVALFSASKNTQCNILK